MKVYDLIATLQDMDPEAEVRIAEGGYRSHFEYSVDDIVETPPSEMEPEEPAQEDYQDSEGVVDDAAYDEAYDAYEDAKEKYSEETVVYLAQGTQLGYLNARARTELGW